MVEVVAAGTGLPREDEHLLEDHPEAVLVVDEEAMEAVEVDQVEVTAVPLVVIAVDINRILTNNLHLDLQLC